MPVAAYFVSAPGGLVQQTEEEEEGEKFGLCTHRLQRSRKMIKSGDSGAEGRDGGEGKSWPNFSQTRHSQIS